MSFTSPFTAVTGATITAAGWNTGGRDNLNAIWVYTTAGDIAYATGAADLARLAIGAAYTRLRVNAAGNAPEYGGPAARVTSVASSATPTPNADTTDAYLITAQATAANFAAPTGTPLNFQALVIRIKDNGTARALSFPGTAYQVIGLTLPTTTVAGKWLVLTFLWNATDSKWDCMSANQQA